MATMPEVQKSSYARKYNAPDMSKVVSRSTLSGNNYTCAICSASVPKQLFKQHLAEAHGCVNKEPFHK